MSRPTKNGSDLPGLLADPDACTWANTSSMATPITAESLAAAVAKIKADYLTGKGRSDPRERYSIPMSAWLKMHPELPELETGKERFGI